MWEFPLSVRAANALRRAGINCIAELVDIKPEELLRLRNVGAKTIRELRRLLQDLGLDFGMPVAVALSKMTTHGSSPSQGELNLDGITIDSLELSVRARNVLRAHRIQTIAQLTSLSPDALLRFRSCGRGTVAEIEHRLGRIRLGLRRGQAEHDARNAVVLPRTIELTASQKAQLIRGIAEHNWSVRTDKALRKLGLRFTGDLVQLAPPDLMKLRNFGARSLAEIESRLLSCGLHLGIRLPEWDDEVRRQWAAESRGRLQRIRETEALAALEIDGRLPQTLEDELSRFVSAYVGHRRAEMVRDYYGWGGEAPKTLEEVGNANEVTRERVRQILTKFQKRIASIEVYLPILQRTLTFISGSIPIVADELEKRLVEAGLCTFPIRIEGVLAAARVAGLSVDLVVHELPEGRVVGPPHLSKWRKRALSRARKLVSRLGCCTLDEVQGGEPNADETESFGKVVRYVLEHQDGFSCLDREGSWFWFRDVPRNGLLNRVHKALAANPRIPSGELRAAVSREYRMGGMAPPKHVLEEFCRQQPEFGVADGVVERIAPIDPKTVLSKSEYCLMCVLRSSEGLLQVEDLESRCKAQGMSGPTFWARIVYSPIITKLGTGLYCLVGTDIKPGEVEDHLRGRQRSGRLLLDYGWTPDGEVWLAYQLSRSAVSTGVLSIPTALRGLLEGEHELKTPDGASFGNVYVKGAALYGLTKLFNRRGGEPGDVLVVAIAPGAERATARLGDHSLLDDLHKPSES